MSVSRFRHTRPTVAKPEEQFLNIISSQALWSGSNMISCNEYFVAIPWVTRGSTAVFRHEEYGRVSGNPPLFIGHEGAVIDTRFDPFDHYRLVTAGEDGYVNGWTVPEGGMSDACDAPIFRIKANDKKCGGMSFHPSTRGILSTTGLDKTVRIWDLEKEEAKTVVKDFEDYPMDMSWNIDGSEICVVSRDKGFRVIDTRGGGTIAAGQCHETARSLRCVWAKRKDHIITFGWDQTQRRQMKVWDPRKLSGPTSTFTVDQGSGAMMPMFDDDLNLLYVAYKGEGTIRAYELLDGELCQSHEHFSTESVKGVCLFPKQSLDVKQCEIGRIYELTQQSMATVHMFLPRRQCESEFQSDVYPPTFADVPALSAAAFFEEGKAAPPRECDLKYLFDGSARTTAKGSVPPKKREANLAEVAPLKKPEKRAVQAAPVHADPTANIVPAATEDTRGELSELSKRLENQTKAIAELRRQLSEKEAEMLTTVKQIEKLLSKD